MLGNKKLYLALIGKNIQHSLSKSIYEKILGKEIEYDLLDIESEEQLPKLEALKKYDGVSITSPYKKHYLEACNVDKMIKELGAINCIKKLGDKFEATNTDYLALEELFNEMVLELASRNILIYGDGPMSRIVQTLLNKKGFSFKVYSRNLGNFNIEIAQTEKPSFLINCLSRQVNIPFIFNKNDLLFDLNYKNNEILKNIEVPITYIDGMDLLELQAKFALSFWNIKDC